MAVQLDEQAEDYINFVMAQAETTLKATKFILHRKASLTEEQVLQLADVRMRMISLLAVMTDGEGYGSLDDTVTYAMRGYEADASALLNTRLLS